MTDTTRTDSNIVRSRQSYTLTRTYNIGTDIVRIEVHVDTYQFQSRSTAAVLSSDRKWTTIADADGLNTDAYNVVSPYSQVAKSDEALWSSAAGDLAETLKERAIAILG